MRRALELLAKLERQKRDHARQTLRSAEVELTETDRTLNSLRQRLPIEHAAGWALPGGPGLLAAFLGEQHRLEQRLGHRRREQEAARDRAAEAVRERNERRRRGVTGLVDRIAGKQASPQARKDAVDLIFALTSYPTFASLSAAGRSRDEVCRVVQRACHAALAPLSNPSS